MPKEENSQHAGPAWSPPQITLPCTLLLGVQEDCYFPASPAVALGSGAYALGRGMWVRVLWATPGSSHQVPCMILHYCSSPAVTAEATG